LHVAVARALWGAHYTRKNVIGTRQVIETATREKMFHIQRRFYVPNNSAILISGDVEPDDALRRVAGIFGDWPEAADPFGQDPVPHHPRLQHSATRVVERPVHAGTLTLSWHGPSVELDPEATHAADVLSFILGQRNSRFYRRLVDSGIATSASVHYQTLRYTGPVQAYVVAAPERLVEAHAVLEEEVEALGSPDAFTDEEFENAKHQLEIDQVYEAERPSQLTHTLGYWWAVAGLDYYRGYAAAIRRIRRDHVHDFARRFICGQPRVTGLLIAPEHRAALGALAEEKG
jgi:zinc protease